jgi:predicted enzyme related to lactoylglutathione lyase
MFTRIMYATHFVSNQDRALAFYTEAFGFQKRVDVSQPDGRFLTIAFEDQGFEVLLWPGAAGRATALADRVGALVIESDDLGRDFIALKARGVTLVEAEPVEYRYGWRATALDPDGNPIPLRQRRT